jgi:general secretion pathway protein L
MSLLAIQIPLRPRLRARDQRGQVSASESVARDYFYVWSPDGRQVGRQARATASLLPKADTVVAVLADADLSWHRITLPKAPPARLRAALAGVLEEALLDDAESTHLAIGPGAPPGAIGWVAATHRSWLAGELGALEKAQVFVDRVVPAGWPGETPQGHFFLAESEGAPRLALHWTHPDGAATLELQGGLGRALLPQPLPEAASFSATPAAAADAEAWLGAPVSLLTEAERMLQAAHSPWNLRQFELARRHRGTRALRDAWRTLRGPAWRPVRLGLAALVVVQLVGLNVWAWQLRQQLAERRSQMVGVLQSSFPQVRAVLDAPAQMQREVQLLRAQAGQAGETDLEPLLLAAAAAWPAGRPPVDNLRFEPGRLTLAAAGWSSEEVERFRAQLRSAGWALEQTDGRLSISRAPMGARS